MPAKMGRPPRSADELTPFREGLVRPYVRVRPETLAWLADRGGHPSHRVAILTALLKDRYYLPVKKRAALRIDEEGSEPFRPMLPPGIVTELDKDAAGAQCSRGQVIDAIVALVRTKPR